MKLSIIVPVYNSEGYIKQCVESILNQLFDDFELILVDDGSTDSSPSLIEELKCIDNRIITIHKKNGGAMTAWKAGVAIARGEYVGFVDSDDWIDKNMYEKLINCIEQFQCDMVGCGVIYEYPNFVVKKEELLIRPGFFSRDQIEKEILPYYFRSKKITGRIISQNRVTKLFRRTMLLEIFDSCKDYVTVAEDAIAVFNYVLRSNSIYLIKDFHPYHYRIHNNSVTTSFDINKYECIQKYYECLVENVACFNHLYDEQICSDYMYLLIQVIDQEILTSENCTNKDIQNRWEKYCSPTILSSVNPKYLDKKQRIYFYFLKLHLFRFLIKIRKGLKHVN